MLLAGDIGGTKTLLGLFDAAKEHPGRPVPIRVDTFHTLEFDELSTMVAHFLGQQGADRGGIASACFGVAGPVLGDAARLTNVPWTVHAQEVGARFSIPRVRLLNDLEAMAYAVPTLTAGEVVVLQKGRPVPGGNAAIIAAGTGLGEALLHRVGDRFVPAASEGGHADFAARTEREVDLLRHLTRRYGRAYLEHVVSGPGLVNVFEFVHPSGCPAVDGRENPADLPALISRAAAERRCPRCVEAHEMFVDAYGAAAGNLALRTVATAGVFLGGGIAPKILPALADGTFLRAFVAKDPMRPLLEAMPVAVILNPQAALVGAAVHAAAE